VPRPPARRPTCPAALVSPQPLQMDVVLKGLSLVWTQLSSAARMLLALPSVLLHALGAGDRSPCETGAVFYEGNVKHVRRSPVTNRFEWVVELAAAC